MSEPRSVSEDLVTKLAFDNGCAPASPWGDVTNGGVMGGLTKRERFAMAAMQGIFAHGYTMPNESQEAAEYAVRAADCLLKELAK